MKHTRLVVRQVENLDVLTTFVLPFSVGIVPAVLSYLGSRSQSKNELKKLGEQQKADLLKLKEGQEAELQKLKEQQKAELEKMREQQNAEIQKIKEQSARDIEKMSVEMDKQAELYERNAQTDVTKEFFGKMFSGESDMTQMLGTLQALQGFADTVNANKPSQPQK
ncbi:hypothetical protein [Bacillus wiedmannii]|uniref:hypothetical protein n=1 Tax=Bacillus wiedmannii TaxID=1890302 RepID=UPI003D2073CD